MRKKNFQDHFFFHYNMINMYMVYVCECCECVDNACCDADMLVCVWIHTACTHSMLLHDVVGSKLADHIGRVYHTSLYIVGYFR